MAGMFGSARVAEIFGAAFGVALRRPRGHVVATRIVGVAALLLVGPLCHIGGGLGLVFDYPLKLDELLGICI